MNIVKRPKNTRDLATPWGAAMARANGRCQIAHPKSGAMVSCGAPAIGVLTDGRVEYASCNACRLALRVHTAEEKAAAPTKVSQTALFAETAPTRKAKSASAHKTAPTGPVVPAAIDAYSEAWTMYVTLYAKTAGTGPGVWPESFVRLYLDGDVRRVPPRMQRDADERRAKWLKFKNGRAA